MTCGFGRETLLYSSMTCPFLVRIWSVPSVENTELGEEKVGMLIDCGLADSIYCLQCRLRSEMALIDAIASGTDTGSIEFVLLELNFVLLQPKFFCVGSCHLCAWLQMYL